MLGLLFEISADPSKAITATEGFRDRASGAVREFEEHMMSSVTNSLGVTKEFAVGMGVAAGAVIGLGVAMFELAHHAAEVGSKMYEVSQRTGISAADLSGLNALTKMTGENFDGLSLALGRATLNLQKQIDAGGTSKSVLGQLMGGAQGLADLGLKPMDERIETVVKRIMEMNDTGERNRALQELMGRAWQGNIETLKMLSEEGFTGAIEKAKELGLYFDDVSAKKAKEFEIAVNTLEARMKSWGLVVGETLIPVLGKLMDTIRAEITLTSMGGSPVLLLPASMLKLIYGEAAYNVMVTHDALTKLTAAEVANNEALKQTAEWFKTTTERMHEQQEGMKIREEMVKKQEDAEKELYKTALENQREQQKAWEAHIKFDEEARKADEKLTEETKRLAAERLHFENEAMAEWWRTTSHTIDEEVKAREAASKLMVQQILNRVKAQEELSIRQNKDELARVQEHDKLLLAQHRINRQQFFANEQAALNAWHDTERTRMEAQLALKKELWGEDSAEYLKMVSKMEALDAEWARKHEEIFVKEARVQKKWTEDIIGLIDGLGGALQKHHAIEVGLILARAAIKSGEQIAEGLAELAALHPWQAAIHFASAAEFAALAGIQAASPSTSAGSSSVAGSTSSPTTTTTGPGVSPTLAPGSASGQRNVHVMVVGPSEAASWMAGVIDNGVRYQGVKLTASHSLRPSG